MKAVLKIESRSRTQEVDLERNVAVIFGRSPKAHFILNDEKVSSTHCKFVLLFDRLELQDLDSKNGTFLNGIRIEQSEVFIGDEIKVGDTVIGLHEPKMSSESIDILTFPGPFKDRLNHELRVDFTGARIQNQIFMKAHPRETENTLSHNREIALRRKAKSKIRLSKQEVRAQHRMVSSVANVIDLTVLIVLCCLPFYLVNDLKLVSRDQKGMYLLIGELIMITAFFILNVKIMKYTLGEKIAGIQDLCTKA